MFEWEPGRLSYLQNGINILLDFLKINRRDDEYFLHCCGTNLNLSQQDLEINFLNTFSPLSRKTMITQNDIVYIIFNNVYLN